MLKRVAKAVGYYKKPKHTFALLHPFKALKLGAVVWLGRKIFGGSRG